MLKKIGRNDPCWCGSGKKYKDCHLALDEKINSYKLKGWKIPPKKIIKRPDQIDGIRESGLVNIAVLDYVAENIHAGTNALYMCAVVQRCKRDEAFDALDDLFVNENGFAEERASLNDTVADSSDFAQILNDADFTVEKCVLDLLERFSMVRHADFDFLLSAVCRLVAENAHFKANFLAVSLCKHLLVVHIDQLILK